MAGLLRAGPASRSLAQLSHGWIARLEKGIRQAGLTPRHSRREPKNCAPGVALNEVEPARRSTVAALVRASRIEKGKHFLSDVLFGATLVASRVERRFEAQSGRPFRNA